MEQQKMSITRALRELSLLDKRISDSVQGLKVVDVTQEKYKGKALNTNQTVEQFEKLATSKFQSIQDLIDRRNKIKRAIVESNAKTKVSIAQKEMTVAEAIEQKNSIDYKKALLQRLKVEHATIVRQVENHRSQLDQQVSRLVEQNTGKDRRADADDYKKISEPFIQANELKLVDPVKVSEKIEVLEEEISKFEADVDIVLSESNSRTEIVA